jgi:protoporphyrinogen oxidase
MIPFARRALSGPSDGPGPSGTTTLARLTAAGISRGTIDRFFRPFFGGVFFDTSLSTDAGRLDFLLRMFAEGFACVPAKGMGEIPKLMLAAAPSVRVRLGSRVERVESRAVVLASGERVEADAVILATGAHDLERLLAPIAPDFPQTAWCGTFSAWFATPDPAALPSWLVLNGSGLGSFNHGAAMSAIAPSYAPSYAPSGRGLFVANTTFLPKDRDNSLDLAADMQRTLREILGRDATDGWELLTTQRIRHAIPRQWPQDVARGDRARSTALPKHIFLAGDHLEDSSINGAMRSGRRAAEAILAAR